VDFENNDCVIACFRRFTEQFAKKAHSVTCVDFLPSVLALNRKAHSDCGNISFIDADVTKLDQPDHRFLHILWRNKR